MVLEDDGVQVDSTGGLFGAGCYYNKIMRKSVTVDQKLQARQMLEQALLSGRKIDGNEVRA
jgi:hypothetical protein